MLEQLKDITGVSDDGHAAYLLEVSGFNLQAAVSLHLSGAMDGISSSKGGSMGYNGDAHHESGIHHSGM